MSELIQIQGLGPLTQPHSEPPFHKGLKAGTIVSCLATVLTAQFLPAIAWIFWWLAIGLGTAWAWQAGSQWKPTIDKQDFGFSPPRRAA